MGEGEGREEESRLIHTGIIWPPFSFLVGGPFISRIVNEVNPKPTSESNRSSMELRQSPPRKKLTRTEHNRMLEKVGALEL